MQSNEYIEQWEYQYYNEIVFILNQDIDKMIKGLRYYFLYKDKNIDEKDITGESDHWM